MSESLIKILMDAASQADALCIPKLFHVGIRLEKVGIIVSASVPKSEITCNHILSWEGLDAAPHNLIRCIFLVSEKVKGQRR